MKLYQIADQYESILNEAINPETGEINETALMKLDDIKDDVKEKGIAVASFIKNMEAERNAIEAARKIMAEREARLDREMSWLDGYLKGNMERCGISEISSPYFVVKLKKCPVSVNVMDEDAIPDEYKKVKTTTSIDKAMVKEGILAGIVIPGAELKQNVRLEIR